jgi:hypothetical protein
MNRQDIEIRLQAQPNFQLLNSHLIANHFPKYLRELLYSLPLDPSLVFNLLSLEIILSYLRFLLGELLCLLGKEGLFGG